MNITGCRPNSCISLQSMLSQHTVSSSGLLNNYLSLLTSYNETGMKLWQWDHCTHLALLTCIQFINFEQFLKKVFIVLVKADKTGSLKFALKNIVDLGFCGYPFTNDLFWPDLCSVLFLLFIQQWFNASILSHSQV